ncbi:SulP family inorganic anion transporter [Ascidiaceihabitans sp.]|uniref:SulP family inorganic anion transporter n=1 Tax=Ascidiaceihabitans sp. TaxID=1872644 RepID=UPI003297F43C
MRYIPVSGGMVHDADTHNFAAEDTVRTMGSLAPKGVHWLKSAVAVVSLMTAAILADVTQTIDVGYATAALSFAGLSGLIWLAIGVLRMGFIANFLSHPIISGFITASGILIAISQIKHVLGIKAHGHTMPKSG